MAKMHKGRAGGTHHLGGEELSEAMVELDLYIENDEPLYRMQKAIIKNLAAKTKRGAYVHSKAPQAWSYFVEAGAKKYAKEFATAKQWSIMFPKKERDVLARHYAQHFALEHGFGGKVGKAGKTCICRWEGI